MKHGSLFSGIGGFDLAASWMGWENVFQVEWNKRCQEVLKRRFPNAHKYLNVKDFDGTKYRGTIDILSGGDPCQPNSVAGLGMGTADVRFLWPEMFRIAQELNVSWIVNENVSGSIANGVLDIKINDLESVGYTCQPYCIPAESLGALHQRERVWLVAYNSDFHRDNQIARAIRATESQPEALEVQQHEIHQPRESVDLWIPAAPTDGERWEEYDDATRCWNKSEGLSRYFGFGADPHGNITRDTIESGIIRMLDGLPEGMDYADRGKRIEEIGNSICPQVAYEIFKAIEMTDSQMRMNRANG